YIRPYPPVPDRYPRRARPVPQAVLRRRAAGGRHAADRPAAVAVPRSPAVRGVADRRLSGPAAAGGRSGGAGAMNGAIRLNVVDLAVFAAYLVAAVALGFVVSRRGRTSAKAYFLGGKTLPWYVVATSMVAADVSAEHFIANAGVAYRYGIVPATGSWNTWIIYSLFIWIFLPYYVRTGLYTVPQFLERRYNAACRTVFSGSLVAGYVAAIIAGSLYAGAIAL